MSTKLGEVQFQVNCPYRALMDVNPNIFDDEIKNNEKEF
jgi:hypothetical protein